MERNGMRTFRDDERSVGVRVLEMGSGF